MKYTRDSYQILLFGEFGDKMNKETALSLHEAREKAKTHLEKNKEYSAVINRTIWNSKSNNNKWDYKNDNG